MTEIDWSNKAILLIATSSAVNAFKSGLYFAMFATLVKLYNKETFFLFC
jgi:hypothetical protein